MKAEMALHSVVGVLEHGFIHHWQQQERDISDNASPEI
jgi:hypothetical protein